VEEYEYSKTDKIFSHGSTVLKQYEKDTSVLKAIRRLAFYRKGDEGLDELIATDLPMLLTGNKQEIADFMQYSRHSASVTSQIKGNYTFKDTFLLGKKCWEELHHQQEKKTQEFVDKLSELAGRNLMVHGFSAVWQCLKEGNVLELIIDKEYPYHIYLNGDGTKVSNLKAVRDKHLQLVLDPHERLIDLALTKGGKIIFVAPGALKEYGGVAVILHYPYSQNDLQ
jgi:predicted peroxiredoxin